MRRLVSSPDHFPVGRVILWSGSSYHVSSMTLKAIVLLLSVVVACSVYICSRKTVVVGVGRATTGALLWKPSTRESTVPPTLATKVNLDRHFQELPSRYTPHKPTAVVNIPSISSADIQPCKNDTICQENLSNSDLTYWQSCVEDYRQSKFGPPVLKCRFMDGTNRYPVALASLPGSGNTWVRGLLEQATGICTGDIKSQCIMQVGRPYVSYVGMYHKC